MASVKARCAFPRFLFRRLLVTLRGHWVYELLQSLYFSLEG